jgi:hypothetical protein
MGPSRSSLVETFRELTDDELVSRCTSGELTDFAPSIALEELRARGLELPRDPPVPQQPEQGYLGDWVTVAKYLSYTEVHILRSCLEAAGVPAEVADAQLVQTDALLTPAMRGASVRVPANYAGVARKVIAAYRRGDFRLDDDFDPGPRR